MKETWRAKSKQEDLKKLFKDPEFSEYVLEDINDRRRDEISQRIDLESTQEQKMKQLNETKAQIEDPKKRKAYVQAEREALNVSSMDIIGVKKRMEDLTATEEALREMLGSEDSGSQESSRRKSSQSSQESSVRRNSDSSSVNSSRRDSGSSNVNSRSSTVQGE